MTPTFLFLVLLTARRTPGSITPITGIDKALLQAAESDGRRSVARDDN